MNDTDLNFAKACADLPKSDQLSLRKAATNLVQCYLKETRQQAEVQLLGDGNGTKCAEFLSSAQDNVIKSLYALALQSIDPELSSDFAIIATGGYGRGTLAPGSDIDLLFLLPAPADTPTKSAIEFILYALWDAKLKVGHATRLVEECIALAKTDLTILTSILEARYISGAHKLFDELTHKFKVEIVATRAKQFVTEKLAERDARHAKNGQSRYAVEPDLKDGKGGLRDLQTLFWIAKFIFSADSTAELAEKKAFSTDEIKTFERCEAFLHTVRCHLHFSAGRGEDKLSFEHQSDIAARLKYRAHGGLRAVERFMRHYFLIAKDVGDLTRIFCASLEEKHLKEVQGISRIFTKLIPKRKLQTLGQGLVLENGRIDVAETDFFNKDPVNILRIFATAAETMLEIQPDALKLMRKSFRLIDDSLRCNPEANSIFLDILCTSATPEHLLRMMNEAGVLGRFIPDFGRIVAMMQFSMYHHYTVDEHLIRAVGVLTEIETGKAEKNHPLAASLFPTLSARRALYVATLLHDIAKGRLEDHSIAGEKLAREICPRLGLSPDETDLVAWAIRYHLLMSETSQMRDLNDFKTILDFVKIVQTPERLKLLLILTVADIRAVGPGVWNGWKGQLLRTLYMEAEPLLTGGHAASSRQDRLLEAQTAFFSRIGEKSEEKCKEIASRHYDAYWLNVPLERQLRHHTLLNSHEKGEVKTAIATDTQSGVTEIAILAPDHPRLLALLTGACAAAGGNIIGAHIFTTTDGMALDTITLTRAFKADEDETRRANRVCTSITNVLHGKVRLRDELAKTENNLVRAKAFDIAARVVIDNGSSNKNTIIEASGLDRVGLLHALTEALFHLNLNIVSAHITTFGEKAVDVFYVTDLTGGKIESPTRMKQIETKLLSLWHQGNE